MMWFSNMRFIIISHNIITFLYFFVHCCFGWEVVYEHYLNSWLFFILFSSLLAIDRLTSISIYIDVNSDTSPLKDDKKVLYALKIYHQKVKHKYMCAKKISVKMLNYNFYIHWVNMYSDVVNMTTSYYSLPD